MFVEAPRCEEKAGPPRIASMFEFADSRRRPAAGGVLDPERLPALVDRLHRAAWAICGSPQEAEDLVQETFARVLARPRDLHNGDPTPYLMQALRNTYLTGVRTASRRPRTSEFPSEEGAAMQSTLARPDVAFEHHETFAAIAALSPDFRETLIAVDIVGLSYREAAEALGTREATVTSRLFRARGEVARALSSEDEVVAGKRSA
jgi:RNA polymerase sigma-70 factor (ECF subfamily)